MRWTRRARTYACLAVLTGALAASPAGAQYIPPQKHALLIGVKTYPKNSDLRSLSYTESDIEGLAQVLAESGYRRANIRVMTQSAAAGDPALSPTLANIRAALKTWLANRREGDTLLLAFAGHGVQFRGSETQYFCPADARLSDPKNTLLSLNEVYRQLEACKAGFKVLLVDACRNDPTVDMSRGAGPAKLPRVRLDSDSRPDRAETGAAVALYSCSRGEKAYEHDSLKRSVFFHFVIQGLRGSADGNKDGKVTLSELVDYVSMHVPHFSKREFEALQTPELQGTLRGSMSPLALPPRRYEQAPPEVLSVALRFQMEAKLKTLIAQGWTAFSGDFRTSTVTLKLAGHGTHNHGLLKIAPGYEVAVVVLSQGSSDVDLFVHDPDKALVTSDVRVNADPEVAFEPARKGDYRVVVRNMTSSPAECVLIALMRFPMQEMRFLRVVNKSAKTIRVSLQYEAKTQGGGWHWYHSGRKASPVTYTLRPGQSADLYDAGWRVKGRRVRIWARATSGNTVWHRDRDQDVWLARDRYRSPNPALFTYTFH